MTGRDRCCWPNGPRSLICSPTPNRPVKRTGPRRMRTLTFTTLTPQPLTAEGMDDAIAESMRDRLAAIDRALKRLDEGTYGRSVRSGVPIPPERLEADPA